MGWIIGILIQIVTYPGVIMQTVALRLFCDLAKVEVYEVDYVRGKIVHSDIPSLHQAFLIALAPFFLNSILCMLLTFPAAFSILNDSDAGYSLTGIITAYLGICTGMHAFPSKRLIDSFTEKTDVASANGFARAIYKLVSWIFWLFNFLRRIWADAAYTFVMAMILPFGVQTCFGLN